MKAFRELVLALKGLNREREGNPFCCCDCAIDNPNMHGEHSSHCKYIRQLITSSESELARMENAISSEGVFYGNEDEAIKLTALFSTRMLKGKRVKIMIMEVE
jgi:hypothetical protein